MIEFKSYLILICLFLPMKTLAFPEMVRHGYTSCTACHVSPSGGGVLTRYGRELSKEILSMWGKDSEKEFLNGMVDLPEGLNVGGDLRYMQLFRKNQNVEEAKSFWMQTDLEVAATIKNYIIALTGGIQQAENSDPSKSEFISRRHYVGYKFNDNWSTRAGRFYPAYGLNIPEHTSVIKRGLRWDQGQETYNLEANYLKDNFDIFVTGLFGRPDQNKKNSDEGISISSGYTIAEKVKIGLNFLKARSEQYDRQLYGVHALAAYDEQLYFLSEFDWQNIKFASASQEARGFFAFNKVGYEFIQGLHFNFTFEYGQSDLSRSSSIVKAMGPGFQFFPRPHFEINGIWSKQQIVAVSEKYGDFAYVILHYYF